MLFRCERECPGRSWTARNRGRRWAAGGAPPFLAHETLSPQSIGDTAAELPVGFGQRQVSGRLLNGIKQRTLARRQLLIRKSTGSRRDQVALVPGCHPGARDGDLATYRALFHQAVQFAVATPSEQFHELGLGHSALFVEETDGRHRFLPQAALLPVKVWRRKYAGADMGLESGRQQGGEGGEQGAAIVAAQPFPEVDVLIPKERRGIHCLQDIPRGEFGTGR